MIYNMKMILVFSPDGPDESTKLLSFIQRGTSTEANCYGPVKPQSKHFLDKEA
jgi:hypothetical protein